LPSRANIGRFVTSVEDDTWFCPFCKGTLETLGHIFLDCDFASIFWSSWLIITSGFSTMPISYWILAIPRKEASKFQLFTAIILDYIWFSKSKLIHEDLVHVSTKAIKQVSTSLELHLSTWHAANMPSLWFPPLMGSVKGNFDVAVRNSFVVPAAVISDSSGNIVLAAMHKLPSIDFLQGEAFADLLATQLVVSCGCGNFFLEGDVLLVLLAVNNPFMVFF
jgi:hypothetical protein